MHAINDLKFSRAGLMGWGVILVAAFSATGLSAPAAAQGSVTVDNTVLQELGSPLNVPWVLRGQPGAPPARLQAPRQNFSLAPTVAQQSLGPQFPIIRNGRLVLPNDTIDLNKPAAGPAPKLTRPKTTKKKARPVAKPKPVMRKPEPRIAAKPKPPVARAPLPPKAPPPVIAAAPRAPTLPPAGVPAAPTIPSAPKIDSSLPTLPPPVAVPALPATPPAETKIASLPKAAAPTQSGNKVQLDFPAGGAKLSSAVATNLNGVATKLKSDPALRVQLMAYAAEDGKSTSQARRLSLSRALAVRSHLIAQGIKSTRIDVRALGAKAGGGPADRVDVIVNQR